ncbi:MAG TPA: long-chain-fatty-acid--CoA ligase [Dehalococcoidales bacterium]|nr:long-chain-fatty-acid--CoA ligase [Dehalococcoidales bacterium]
MTIKKVPTKHTIENLVTPEGHTEPVYAGRPRNLGQLLDATANRHARQEGFAGGETRMSYGQIGEAVGNLASSLHRRHGIDRGDRVVLMLRNGAEFVLSFFALARLGAIAVPLNTALKGEELAFQVQDSGAALVITEPEFSDLMTGAASGAENVKGVVVTGGTPPGAVPFARLLQPAERPSPPAAVSEDDAAVLMYTSGTTGKPKGALLTHKGIIASAMSAAELCALRPGHDRMLVVAPLFHITGLAMNLSSAVYKGVPAVFVRKYKTADVLKTIQDQKITAMFAVPTILWLMLNAPEFGDYNLASLRVMASGGAATPDDLLRCCAARLPGAQLKPGYGLTEACGMTHSTASIEEALGRPGSSGLPLPVVDSMIAGADGKEMPPGKAGELLIRGCQVMKGYWKNPEATRETLVDGWLHTGDVALVNEDGHYYICDRLKDMIIRGGENIYSLEVENVLYRHPAVLEAAVVGVPDPVFGEQVKAVLVLRPGQKAAGEEIQEFCEQHLARYKVPKYVEFRDALPRNPAGKIIKGDLR